MGLGGILGIRRMLDLYFRPCGARTNPRIIDPSCT